MKRFISLFALLLLVIAPIRADVAKAQTPLPTVLVDLPAAVITPADADGIGLSGFGRFGNGHMRLLDEYAQQRSDFLQKPVDEVIATLTDAGWLQGYSTEMGLPDHPGSENAQPLQVIFTSIYQFESADGAAAALPYITDYSGVTGAVVDTTIGSDNPVGDASVWSRTTSATLDQQGPSDELSVVFRSGDLIAAVGEIDYTVTTDTIATPSAVDPARVDQVAALAGTLQERLTSVATGDAPGFSHQIIRIGSEGAMPAITDEGYRRLDGADIPYFNGYQDDFPGLASAATDAYEYTAALGQGSDPYDPYFALRLYHFPDDAAASSFLAETLAASAETGSPVPVDRILGDESILVPESFEAAPGVTVHGYQSLVRSGRDVSLIIFESADHRPDPAVVLELASAQSTCLDTGDCPMVPIPTDW